MFKRRSPEIKAAEAAFDSCTLKEIEYTETAAVWGDTYGMRKPTSSFKGSESRIVGSNAYRAELHCPRTTSSRVTITDKRADTFGTQPKALKSLRESAVRTVCQACPFAGKSEVDLINAEVARNDALANLLQSRTALRAAMEELDSNSEIAAAEKLLEDSPFLPLIDEN